jgi:hypothetical protein
MISNIFAFYSSPTPIKKEAGKLARVVEKDIHKTYRGWLM